MSVNSKIKQDNINAPRGIVRCIYNIKNNLAHDYSMYYKTKYKNLIN